MLLFGQMESAMYDEFCAEQRKRAEAHLTEFLQANPEYSLGRRPPQWLKGTHQVTFGTYRGEAAVFKYYDGDPRREYEKRALELFEPTGLVPRVFGETDVMLVMQRLPGLTMYEMEKDLSQAEHCELYRHLGEAVAKVVATVPGSDQASRHVASFRASDLHDFYSTPHAELMVLYREADTATFFDTTLARSARALRDRDVPHKETLTEALTALDHDRDAILARPSFVHMDDFHTNNIMADGVKITGFIDLEMTRRGNEVLLLGAALSSMSQRRECWPSFRCGYEDARGAAMDDRLLLLVRAAATFSMWIRFTWYWSIDDLPWWAREADLRSSAVREITQSLEAVERMELSVAPKEQTPPQMSRP